MYLLEIRWDCAETKRFDELFELRLETIIEFGAQASERCTFTYPKYRWILFIKDLNEPRCPVLYHTARRACFEAEVKDFFVESCL